MMNPFDVPPSQISKEELQAYKEWFVKLRFSSTGSTSDLNVEKVVLKPDVLFKYLASSDLPSSSLSKAWDLAGGTAKGGLGLSEFQIACKLIALAQAGLPIALDQLGTKTNMANFSMVLPHIPGISGPTTVDGFSTPGRVSALGTMPSFTSSSSSPPGWIPIQRTGASIIATPTGSLQGLTCTQEEKAKFTSFFESSGPVDGYLAGTIAQEIFLKSQLPPETLRKIWNLIDKDGLGKFSLNLFCVGMWIITKIKTGVLKDVPRFIPPSLWNSITASGTVAVSSPLFSSFGTTSLPPQPVVTVASLTADMTDADRAQYKSYFDSIDTSSKGTLTGSECSTVFLKSKLPETDLALIWDLVDTKKTGKIDREQFALAMFLIKKRIGGAQLPLPSAKPAAPVPVNIGATGSLLDFSTPSLSSKPTSIPKQSEFDLLQGPPMPSNVPDKSGLLSPTSMPALSQASSSTSNPIMMAASTFSQSVEMRDLETKEKNMQIRHQELSMYQVQLQELKPNAEELKKKREKLDQEYRSVTERRNQVSIELSQLRADYELDLETMKDRQSMLESDKKALLAAQTEITQYKEAIAAMKKENENLLETIESQKRELVIILKTVAELESETASLREATHQLFDEARQQKSQIDYHTKILESGKQEHDIVKKNLELEQGRLEADKKKVMQLEQQASVQQAIIEKEKLRMETMEKERMDNVKKSQELMGSIQSMDATIALATNAQDKANSSAAENLLKQEEERKSLVREQILATAVSSEQIVLPINEPAPPIPPASAKPLKSSITNVAEASVESGSTVPVSAAHANTPASLLSVESTLSKNDKYSVDSDFFDKSKAEKTPTTNATAVAPPPSSSIDFDSFFSATPPTTEMAKPPPYGPASSSINGNLVSSKYDAESLMEKAFAKATLKQAKDTPSLASEARIMTPTSIRGGTTLSNSACVNELFSFNASFGSTAAPSKKQTDFITDPFGTGFNKSADVDFGDFTSSFPIQSNTLSQQDLDSVFGSVAPSSAPNQFASQQNSDPFGINASGGNDPFGGFGGNPFDAFNTPFPPPTTTNAASTNPIPPPVNPGLVNSPAPSSNENGLSSNVPITDGGNAPEVSNIMSMGFTREQALNSLEAHGWNVERAINYLLESASG